MVVSTVALQSSHRLLLGSGVKLNYNVKSSKTYDELGKVLNGAISGGFFGNKLRKNTCITVTASAGAVVTDVSPTSMPTVISTASTESVSNLRLGTTPIIMIAVVGCLLIPCILFAINKRYFGRKNRYLAKGNTIVIELV